MTGKTYSILILEDEPLILLDLELAAQDRGCEVHAVATCEAAVEVMEKAERIDVAILDVSLGRGETCFPVAHELSERGIPYILHSGDLDRHDEMIRSIKATLVAKPAASDKVISAAIVCAEGEDPEAVRTAAE